MPNVSLPAQRPYRLSLASVSLATTLQETLSFYVNFSPSDPHA